MLACLQQMRQALFNLLARVRVVPKRDALFKAVLETIGKIFLVRMTPLKVFCE